MAIAHTNAKPFTLAVSKMTLCNYEIFSAIFFLFTTFSLIGQTADNTNRFNERNIYYQALTQYLHYLKSSSNYIPDTLYIEDDFSITDSLMLQSGQTKFIKLNYDDRIQMFKKQNSFILYRIFPLKFDKGSFFRIVCAFYCDQTKKKEKSILFKSW
jgi:hypothetical protein